MELRDGLARRLAFVYRKVQHWDEPEVHWDDPRHSDSAHAKQQTALWKFMANECIRQMEWVRRQTLEECGQPWEHPLPPLISAPEDWQP